MAKEINLDEYEPIAEEKQTYIKGIDLNEYEPIIEKPSVATEPVPEKEDSGILTEAYKSFVKTFLDIPKGIGALAERTGEAIGSEKVRQFGETLRKSMKELQAGELPLDFGFFTVQPRSVEPDIQSISDIKSTRDALKYITSNIGQMGGYVAQQFLVPGGGLLQGTAGKGILGKAIQLAKPATGEIPIGIAEAGSVLEETKQREEEAKAAGLPYEEPSIIRQLIGIGTGTKLERLGLEFVLGRLGIGPEAAKNLSKNFIKRIGEGVLVGSIGEGAEEFLQNYPETWGAGGDLQELFSMKTFKSGLEQAIGGAIGGGFFGGLYGGLAKRANYARRKEIEDYINNPDVPIESRLNALEAIKELISAENEEVGTKWWNYALSRILNMEETPDGGISWNPLPIDITSVQPADKLGIEIERQLSLLDKELGSNIQEVTEVAKAEPEVEKPVEVPVEEKSVEVPEEKPPVEKPVEVPKVEKPEEAKKVEKPPVTGIKPVMPDKYFIYARDEFKEVEGRKTVIPGFENYDFFIYRDENGKWVVTEGKTGLRVSEESKTKKDAIESAKARLEANRDKLDIAIEKSLISPRWAKAKPEEEAKPEEKPEVKEEIKPEEEKVEKPEVAEKPEEAKVEKPEEIKPPEAKVEKPEIEETEEEEIPEEEEKPKKKPVISTKPVTSKYYIRIKNKFEEVEGNKIVIPGFENYDLFIYNDKYGWQIAEGKTGLLVGGEAKTKKEVVEKTKARLEANKDKLDKLIEESSSEILSPRWTVPESEVKEEVKAEKPEEAEEAPEEEEAGQSKAKERLGQKEVPPASEPKPTTQEGQVAMTPAEKTALPSEKIAEWVKDKLSKGEKIDKLSLFNKATEEFGGTRAEGKFTSKDAFDALELGINKYIETMDLSKTPIENIEKLRNEILNKIPSQSGLRSEEQEEFQQFSTPPDLAYVMTWVANVTKNDVVVEPSAGIGGIAVFAKKNGAKVIVNELSKRRAKLLKKMNFDAVYSVNAEQLNNMLPYHVKPSVIIMNPPFSATAGRIKGQRSTFNIIKHIDSAFKRLEADGRLVLLTGKDWRGESKILNAFLKYIKEGNNTILADITISGKGYEKYGTTYDTRLIVIDKAKKDVSTIKDSVEDIKDAIKLLEGVRNERIPSRERESIKPEGEEVPEGGIGQPTVLPTTGERLPGRPPITGTPGLPSGSATVSPAKESVEVPGEPGRRGEGGRLGERGGQGELRERGEYEGRTGEVSISEDRRLNEDNLVIVKEAQEKHYSQETPQSIFEKYTSSIQVEGAAEHPVELVESSAMAATKLPKQTYQPKIGNIVKEGKISIAQLEAIVYAGQAHSKILGDGKTRQGFFIGDGTGVGKGRTIAAIILDNWNQGRKKHIWVSKNFKLIRDARRDLNAIGFTNATLIDLSKVKASDKITDKEGIVFVSYDTLRSKQRLNQIAQWLGENFDGVITFDEAHLAGNAIDGKELGTMNKASKRALATVDLQKKVPNARIIYASATGATEVSDLSFAERLGLWGEGTSFAKKLDFIKNIAAGGIATMEMVAQSLKSMGVYIARALSLHGIKYETITHKLTADQRDIYNELAKAWRVVFKNLEEAIRLTGAGKRYKSNAEKLFWSSNQRFFNQILIAMQTPTLINSIEKDLENGHCAIVQLVNTNEAALDRALAKVEDEEDFDLSSIDITLRDELIGFVRNCFPVAQQEEYQDEDGNIRVRDVLDENGQPVLNKEAVALRDQLIENLKAIRVPLGALDMIMTHFGPEMVAEVTGRTKRLIVTYENGEKKTKIQSWSEAKSLKDVDDFMNDKKRILVFSDAGGTGASYHADTGVKNQRLRRHYLLQPGWRATMAIQGLGRSHRAGQKQPPEFILITTDVKGQRRFISSIARRLEQLGALTTGQRDTAGQGIFSAQDNLETIQAHTALRTMLESIARGDFSHMDITTFEELTGLKLTDQYGRLKKETPEITQFMNRILAMPIDLQNLVFDYFEQHHKRAIERAIEDGTLDRGLEYIKAKRAHKISEEVVYDKNNLQVKAVQVEITNDAVLRTFGQSEQWAKAGYYRNIKSGQIWAASDVFQKTVTRTGEVIKIHSLIGPRNVSHDVEQHILLDTQKYERVDKKTAEELWNKEYKELPKEVTKRELILTGVLLAVWDRLPNEKIRTVRVTLDSGERILGRLIPHEQIDEVLKKLGTTTTTIQYSPKQLIDIIMKDGAVELVNKWRIEKRIVDGDPRIIIRGYTVPSFEDILKKYGVFTEKVQWTTDYYIPTNAKGVEVLQNIIEKISPVFRVVEKTEYPVYARTYTMVKKPLGTKAKDLSNFLKPKLEKLSKNIDTNIKIIQSNYDLPEDFIKRAKDFNRDIDLISGAYDWKTDTLYVIANGIDSPLMAENIIIQELVGHKGLSSILKPLELSMIRNSIYEQFKETKEMRKVIDIYRIDTSTLKGKLKAADEYMVHYMPNVYNTPSIIQKIVAFIRRALRKLGFAIDYNEDDIRFLMNRAWENMRKGEVQLRGEEGIFFSRVNMSERTRNEIENNAIKAGNPELAYKKSSDFKARLKESLGRDINTFIKYFYNPFFKGQKIPQWKTAFNISEERREIRSELNHKYFVMTRDFYGLQGESLNKIEKILIEGDATLPYKYRDMVTEATRLRKEGNTELAKELREKAKKLRELNRYSDEELKEGITLENGEKVSLNEKEIEIYKSIRQMFDQMHNDWYVHQMNTLLRAYRDEKWFIPFMEIYAQRDLSPEMQKLWKTINRYAFDNYSGKKEATIEKKRNADRIILKDYFGTDNLQSMVKAYKQNIKTINQIRKARNRLGQWIAYFPRVRPKGKYYINVYQITKEMKGDKEIEKKTLLFNTTFDTVAEGENLEKELKEEFKERNPVIELGKVTKESEQTFIGAGDMNLQRLLDNAIARLKWAKDVDKNTLENIKTAMVEAVSNELKSRGFARHGIRRKWRLIKGYETTGLQKILRDYITGFTGMMTKQSAAIDFLDLLKTVERKQVNLYEDISKYARDMLRNQEAMDRISGHARSLAFVWYLGANIRPMILQITQNYVTGMPFLGQKMREWDVKGLPEKYYHRAMIDVARAKTDKMTGEIQGKALNQWERRMINEMINKGIAQDQYIQEITGQMKNRLGHIYDRVLYYLSYPFSQMEIFNRKSAGLAMFRLAWEHYSDIKNEEERYERAFDEAKEYIYKTHYAYGKENLPRVASGGTIGGVATRTALTFRSFTHNYLLSLVNSGDWKTVAHSFAYIALFGGLLGLPIIKDLLELITKWTGKDYTKTAREVMRKFGGRTFEILGMNGLPALAGANISGSLAIGLPPPIGGWRFNEVFGAVEQLLIEKPILAVQSLRRGDYYRAIENIAPEFVGNPMRAYRMATIGATTQRGKIMYDEYGKPIKLTEMQAGLKTMGITPMEYSLRAEAERSIVEVKEYFKDWHDDIFESYRVAKLNHDTKALNNALKEIKKYNQAIRDKGARNIVSPIKLSNLIRAAKTTPTKEKLRESIYKRGYIGA